MILPHSRSENFAALLKNLQKNDIKDIFNALILPIILPLQQQLTVAANMGVPHTFPAKNNTADTSQ